MSKQNVEIVRRAYEAFNKSKVVELVPELLHDLPFVFLWPSVDTVDARDRPRRDVLEIRREVSKSPFGGLGDIPGAWEAERRGDQVERLAGVDDAKRQHRARAGIHKPNRSLRSAGLSE